MASFEPFVSSDPFNMETFNSKIGGAFDKVDGKAGMKMTVLWENPNSTGNFTQGGTVNLTNVPRDAKFIGMEFAGASNQAVPFKCSVIVPFEFAQWICTPMVERSYPIVAGNVSYPAWYTAKINISNVNYNGTAELSGWFTNQGNIATWNNSIFKIFALS